MAVVFGLGLEGVFSVWRLGNGGFAATGADFVDARADGGRKTRLRLGPGLELGGFFAGLVSGWRRGGVGRAVRNGRARGDARRGGGIGLGFDGGGRAPGAGRQSGFAG